MSIARRTITGGVTSAIVAHLVLTIFDNLPHDSFSLRMRLPPVLKKIPQWRFFAPNPGNEDLYVMFRGKPEATQPWSAWENMPFDPRLGLLAPIWNPGSRTPKALFDITHQCRVLAGNSSTYPWLLQSEAFALLSSAVRDVVVKNDPTASRFQFMILAAYPRAGKSGLKPIMVSPELDLDLQQYSRLAGAPR